LTRLAFQVESLGIAEASAQPELSLNLRVSSTPAEQRIDNLLLHAQARLEVRRRRYSAAEERELVELFGAPSRWGESLQSLLWTRTTLVVPAFSGSCTVELPLACTYDLNVAAARYFHGLEEDAVPFVVQLSGSIFHGGADGRLQVAPVPWSCEAAGRLPLALWRQMMELHYPGQVPLLLPRQLVDRLRRFRSARGLVGWEQALEALLDREESSS
jgi:hypothetical protein